MNIHEYQAKAILRDFGVPVSLGAAVTDAAAAEAAAANLAGPVYVVKAQIHAGGRGKGKFKEAEAGPAGGVRITRSPQEAADEAAKMLGKTLVTVQTGATGKQVNRLYIEDGSAIAKEFYLVAPRRPRKRRGRLRRLDRRRHRRSKRSRIRRRKRSSVSPSIRRPASCRIMAARSPHASISPAMPPNRRRSRREAL